MILPRVREAEVFRGARQYVGYSLTNEAKRGPILNEGKFVPSMYTADTIRAQGR